MVSVHCGGENVAEQFIYDGDQKRGVFMSTIMCVWGVGMREREGIDR